MEADIQGTQHAQGPKSPGDYAHGFLGFTASRIPNQEWFRASH